jgi:hypothetical protein
MAKDEQLLLLHFRMDNFFFGVVLGFGFRASHLLSRYYNTWAMHARTALAKIIKENLLHKFFQALK